MRPNARFIYKCKARFRVRRLFAAQFGDQAQNQQCAHAEPKCLETTWAECGAKRFGDAENGEDAKTFRMNKLLSVQNAYKMDGIPRVGIECFDVYSARASMKDGKLDGGDPLAAECFKHLPSVAVLQIWRTFDKFHGDVSATEPAS